jgi:hypothetical protein
VIGVDCLAILREAVQISERKKSISGILGNVAELGASRMEETIGSASLRDASGLNAFRLAGRLRPPARTGSLDLSRDALTRFTFLPTVTFRL